VPYYVVWKGFNPGIYPSWDECEVQVKGFKGAQYKKFKTLAQAEAAFAGEAAKSSTKKQPSPDRWQPFIDSGEIVVPSLAVDAACSGNPGDLEFRCVEVLTGKRIFSQGPIKQGTNNIGEFLGIVHALHHCAKNNLTYAIYSDSEIAMGWVENRYCNSKHRYSPDGKRLYAMIKQAEEWLKENTYNNQIIKWNTERWGEIPADYGRK